MIADRQAELAVIGSVLLDPDRVFDALALLGPEDFTDVNLRTLYGGLAALSANDRPIDAVSLSSELGGRRDLLQLAVEAPESVATAANLEHYAKTVRSKSKIRALVEQVEALRAEAVGVRDADAFIADAQARLLGLNERFDVGDDVVSLSDYVQEFYRDLATRAREDMLPGIRCGIRLIDEVAGGLRKSATVTVGGRPSMGKSALAYEIMLGAAERGSRCMAINLEMENFETTARSSGNRASVDTRDVERPSKLDPGAWQRLAQACRKLKELDVLLWTPARATIEDIRVRVLRHHRKKPIDVVVIDYLQLISSTNSGRGVSREQEVSAISRGTKALARETGATVIQLSQLGREVEKRDPKIPELRDLRESGSIEQDSHQVMMLYRENFYDANADPQLAQVFFRKNRGGRICNGKLRWRAQYQRFEEWRD